MPTGLHLPYVAFFGRTLAEYLDMFCISLDQLREGSTLDCPSGPDSFVAEACAAGCDAVGGAPHSGQAAGGAAGRAWQPRHPGNPAAAAAAGAAATAAISSAAALC